MKHCVLTILLTLLALTHSIAHEKPSIISSDDLTILSLSPGDVPGTLVWTDYGTPFDSFYNVIAYSNGQQGSGRYYQCTELVHRFVREVYGIPSKLGMGLGHGKDLALGIAVRFADVEGTSELIAPYHVSLRYFPSGESEVLPSVGSIVSLLIARHGHVGIIRSIIHTTTDKAEATLFAQHGNMYDEVGEIFQPEKVIFTRDNRGRWHGAWYVSSTKYDAAGWTVPIVSVQNKPEMEASRP